MTKVLNQNLFSAIVYGSELPSQSLRLEATSSGIKGPVQIVGSSLELIVAGQIGRILHANSATRTYTLPDNSGTLFCSGYFLSVGDMVYASAPSTFGVLSGVSSSALVTTASGIPSWTTGSSGQVLTISAGVPSFQNFPDTGTIATGNGNTLPVYQSPGPSKNLIPLTTLANRIVLSSVSGIISWGLLTAPYLSSSGSPLTTGTSGQILAAIGDGTFAWATPSNSIINPGVQYYIPYYSASGTGTEVDDSVFLAIDEISKALKLENGGKLRFYELALNGTNYLEFRSPLALGGNTTFVLPAADGSAGAALTTDGAGNLSFVYTDNGSVNTGVAWQLAYYAVNGNDVSGFPTTSSRLLTSSASGTLTWGLATAPYLAGIGGVPLANGLLNQVLTSTGLGNFAWSTATDLTGKVNSGVTNFLAYYPITGTEVDDTGFLRISNSSQIIDFLNGSLLRIYQPTINGSNYIQLKSPTALATILNLTLPGADGSNGQVLGTDGSGSLSFITVGRGIVDTGTAGTMAYYPASTAEIASFSNVANRVLATNSSNVMSWSLLKSKYLDTGSGPLGTGNAGDVVTADGAGNFEWSDPGDLVGRINSGTIGRIPYYSALTQINSSTFLNAVEGSKAFELLDGGQIRFYEPTGTSYVGLIAASSTSSSLTWILPASDAAVSGEILTSNASGNLSWQSQVQPGATNAIAYYPGTNRQVAPSTNAFYSPTGLSLTGAIYEILGSTATSIILKSGNSGNLQLGVGPSNYLVIDQSPQISLLNQVPLNFYDSTGSGYIGFVAPATVSASVSFVLPTSDGSASQVLGTDGAGNLEWYTASGTINTGSTGTFAIYTGTEALGSSSVIAPVGYPSTDGMGVIVATSGSMTYQMLVTPGASVGQIPFYSASQTLDYTSNLFYDNSNQSVDLKNQTSLRLFDSTSSKSVSLVAAATLADTYALTFPTTAPATDQVLVSDSSGNFSWASRDNPSALQQKGNIYVPSGAEEITVLFDQSFSSKPGAIVAQWAIDGTTLPAFLPTIAVDQVSLEGFVLQFSTATPPGNQYTIYWEAYLNGTATSQSKIYLGGGDTSGGLVNNILCFLMDLDTAAPVSTATFTNPRGYVASNSSNSDARLLGGVESGVSVNTISNFNYGLEVLSDLTATLGTPRSGCAGIGNKTKGFVAGGETIGTGTLTSIEKILFAADAVATLTATLSDTALKRGSSNSGSTGFIVHSNTNSTIDKLNYTTETISLSPVNFGTTNIQVGCNDIISQFGYFSKNTGGLYNYNFNTDTISALIISLTSNSGISGAGNSMRKGYFSGTTLIESLSFRDETITSVNTLPSTYVASSVTMFQTNGMY